MQLKPADSVCGKGNYEIRGMHEKAVARDVPVAVIVETPSFRSCRI